MESTNAEYCTLTKATLVAAGLAKASLVEGGVVVAKLVAGGVVGCGVVGCGYLVLEACKRYHREREERRIDQIDKEKRLKDNQILMGKDGHKHQETMERHDLRFRDLDFQLEEADQKKAERKKILEQLRAEK